MLVSIGSIKFEGRNCFDGAFIIPLPLSILAKYLIITPLSFAIILGLYEFGVRRVNLMRRVFGLKARKPGVPAAGLTAQPLT